MCVYRPFSARQCRSSSFSPSLDQWYRTRQASGTPIKQVMLRASIRGVKDDYHNVDADVVVLAGETHLYRKVMSKLICSQCD